MDDSREQIRRLMRRVREEGQLPSSEEIVRETFERLGYVDGLVNPEDVPRRFNELLRNLWTEALVTLEHHEERSYAEGIPRELYRDYPDILEAAEQIASQQGFRAGTTHLFSTWYPLLRRAFLSVSQSRMSRGGKDFELQIEGLLSLANIPFHKQEIENHTDLILPDLATHERNRNISLVISIKRTLRERWAEVAEELFNTRSPNVFLFTADENVSPGHVAQICRQYNIHLVLWDTEKTQKFSDEQLVLGFTEWASQRLPILQQHWP